MCSRSCRGRRTVGRVRAEAVPLVQRKQSSPFGSYRNPTTFSLTNPRFVLLIRDRRIVLFFLRARH